MTMKKFNGLVAYDDKKTDSMVKEIIHHSTLHKDGDQIWCFVAPAGYGKTTLALRELTKELYKEGVRVFYLLGPQTTNVDDSTIVKHLRKLQTSVSFPIEYHLKADWKKMSEYLDFVEDTDGEGLVILTMTDSSFGGYSKKKKVFHADHMLEQIDQYNLSKQTYVVADEGDIGSTSVAEAMRWTTGVKSKSPNNYVGSKYNALLKFSKKVFGVLDLTATQTAEQDGTLKCKPLMDFILKSKYKIIGTHPTKEEMMLRLAGIGNVIWYDRTGDPLPQIINLFQQNLTDQDRQDELARLNEVSEELSPKRIGLIKLETRYLKREKITIDRVAELLSDYNFPLHWEFKCGFMCDDKRYIFQVNNGEFNSIDDPYLNDSNLYKSLRNSDSDLRFLFVVNKASRGTDIPNNYDELCLRVYGMFNPEKEPVTQTGVQFILRGIRIKVPIEKLVPYFDKESELLQYYSVVNSFNITLPRSEKGYWEGVMNFVNEKYNSMSDIIHYLSNLK